MAKGAPATGDRFTERSTVGVMGRVYGTLGASPYFAAKTAAGVVVPEATDYQVTFRRRRRA